MINVLSKIHSPFFNLAAEEFLLKQKEDNTIMLWRSEPSVIVGKHQNALSEINYKYIREHNIKVARRLSGGGTVVHDLQNLNFTFIANGTAGKLVDFKKFVQPVIAYLETLNIKATIGATNEIRIGELKISGNAEHVYKKRVLHHGTLLFNSDLIQLKKAIEVTPNSYIDKAVQSNRASVTNIVTHLDEKMSIDEFSAGLFNFLNKSSYAGSYSFTKHEMETIKHLSKEKYESKEWIFGYSPKYIFKKNIPFQNSITQIELSVKNGIIQGVKTGEGSIQLLGAVKRLAGEFHLFEPVYKTLLKSLPELSDTELTKLCWYFF